MKESDCRVIELIVASASETDSSKMFQSEDLLHESTEHNSKIVFPS